MAYQWLDTSRWSGFEAKNRVVGGENIVVNAELEPRVDWSAETIPLDVVYADSDLIIVNKPAGLVVHPGHGNPSGTLVNALLDLYPELEKVPVRA